MLRPPLPRRGKAAARNARDWTFCSRKLRSWFWTLRTERVEDGEVWVFRSQTAKDFSAAVSQTYLCSNAYRLP